MDKADKISQLRTLAEQAVRRDVLVPLLGRMGFCAVGEYHGPRELGKDIVCFHLDKLKQRRYLGVVAKTSDITGDVSSSKGVMEVLRQAEQCFNESYHDLFGMRKITMDEVWIVTTGRMISGAADSIFGTLEKTNLSKLVRIVVGEQLVDLLDEHYPTYWNSAAESADQVRGQRDRILSFVRELLRKLRITSDQEKVVVTQLLHSAWTPQVECAGDVRYRVVGASSYSVKISKPAEGYPEGVVSEYGEVGSLLRAAKEVVEHELYDVEEILEKAGKVLAADDPKEFLRLFDQNLAQGHPFYRSMSDAVRAIDYLRDGLQDVERFFRRLDKTGNRERYLQLVISLQALQAEIGDYLQYVEEGQFSLDWAIDESSSRGGIRCLYGHKRDAETPGFGTSHDRDIKIAHRWGEKSRPITVEDVLVAGQLALRRFFEDQMPPDSDDE